MDSTTIQLSREALLAALDGMSEGIAIYGPDLKARLINEAHRKRFPDMVEALDAGQALPDAIRYAVKKALPDAAEEVVTAHAKRIMIGFFSSTTSEVIVQRDRAIRVSTRRLEDGTGVVISVDITDDLARQRELKEKAKQLEQARVEADAARQQAEAASLSKSTFLANMSHEIRTPLNGIMGMAQVLEGTTLDESQKEFVATILDSGNTLMSLLNDVLDLSKIEAGKFDIVPTDASLHHLLRRQLKLWKPRAEEKGLELSLAFDADLPAYLSFDTVRVQQCVSNLVSNAIKFTTEGGIEIFASSRSQPDGSQLVELRVRDTGPGMDAPTLGRLFQAFTQGDETIQRAHGGTGLGLSITRRLAELMGGSATATSEPGQGSTFRITFRGEPARIQTGAGAVALNDAPKDIRETLKRSNLRVLLVDDHPINRQVARLFLRSFNMRIVEAVNGVEALEALAREAFDIVLLDMHMPVMDGPTCIAAIRASGQDWANIPVLALTADAMSGDRERFLGMGMNGYVSKPLSERDLLSEIGRIRDQQARTDHRAAPKSA